ncbi:winged helix-turn-helix transcriptional regulator [Candidatus Saccharibacteria bacterium]|nr:winged helix-turn-helix transcriptional regulator [Candidatus Saccharibacteria bacterium]
MNTNQQVVVLKSIADSTRLAIVKKLAQNSCEITGSEIVNSCAFALKLSQPTMSHHFSKLVQANVVREKKLGNEKCYQLNIATLTAAGINITNFLEES